LRSVIHAGPLFFGDFAHLSMEESSGVMRDMFEDNERIYRDLTRHRYGLCHGLAQKFIILQRADTCFPGGVISSFLTFLAVLAAASLDPATAQITAPSKTSDLTGEYRFGGIYEPSAIHQLPDGRLVVVEDEIEDALSLIIPAPGGGFAERKLDTEEIARANGLADLALDDLEALEVDSRGNVLMVTSHSRGGNDDAGRSLLVRMTPTDAGLGRPAIYGGLKAAIATKHPMLKASMDVLDVKNDGGFNIEGMTFDATKSHLLFGLRSPLIDERAVVFSLENPQDIFDHNDDAVIDDQLITLDLERSGIRGMSYMPKLNGYLVISGPGGRDANTPFQLWFWDGSAAAPRKVTIPTKRGLTRAEGISPVTLNGEEWVMIVYDDGKKKKGKGGHYTILRYEQLSVAPR